MFPKFFFILAAAATVAVAADVRVWEGVLTLPTYEEGPPDSNPPFDQFGTTQFSYPYTLRDNLTSRKANHDWRAVYLENEYLKCSVLPDIGGHLYTCIDKLSGQSMFYANPSIKKARIGYRGAWAAFGIEFNFPVSHNWVSMSPVAYDFTKNPDGSATVRVGNVDRVYGMEWTAELTLRPGSTVLEQHMVLNNRSDVRHRYYWWNNAGVEVKDDDHIIYPMHYSASHGFVDVDTWPVDSSGVDLSIVRNQKAGTVSRFVHASREPFMGVWHPSTRTGVVHYADYGDVPAKKIWSWGVDPDGLDWRVQLSDNNSGYVEVQAGLLRNQETFAFLEPRQTIRFTEYWMPVRDTGGFVRATLGGVLNIGREAGAAKVEFAANRTYPGARVVITQGTQSLADTKVDLAPEKVWKRDLAGASSEPVTVEITDAKGAVVLKHTEGIYDWTPASEVKTGPQQSYAAPAPAKRTEDDWLQSGKDNELVGKLMVAFGDYQEGLKSFPNSFSLHKASGRLQAALLRWADAVEELKGVQARDTSDAEVAYYLGLAYEGLGKTRDARIAFENAARQPQFRAAGTLKLAELLSREGDRSRALELLIKLQGDLRVAETITLLTGRVAKAGEFSPLMRWVANPKDPKLLQFLAADPDRVLNLAGAYMRLGMYKQALEPLSVEYPKVPADQSEPGSLLPQQHPIVALYRAYCHQKLGESSEKDDRLAESLPTKYVFPGGALTLEVLRAAERRNPSSAIVNSLVGTQLFAIGYTEPALAAWDKARQANPKIPALHASIGRVLLNVRRDAAGAESAYREGLTADPTNTEVYSGLDQSLTLLNRSAADRAAALDRYPDKSAMPAELVYKWILNLSEAGEHEKAESLFRGRFFARQEGGTNVRQVWVEVRLQHALSLAAKGQCDAARTIVKGIGQPVDGLDFTREGVATFVNAARTQFLLGKVEAACGAKAEATARWQKVAGAKSIVDLAWAHRAARELPGYDAPGWRERLSVALGRVRSQPRAGYAAALIEIELGEDAAGRLNELVLQPDRSMLLHLSRLERK